MPLLGESIEILSQLGMRSVSDCKPGEDGAYQCRQTASGLPVLCFTLRQDVLSGSLNNCNHKGCCSQDSADATAMVEIYRSDSARMFEAGLP